MGIEPTCPAWKAGALPLSYIRVRGWGRIRTYVDLRRQIYSLMPLTARPPILYSYDCDQFSTPRQDEKIISRHCPM